MSEVELWQLINGADKSMSNTSRSKWGSCCFPDTHSIIICASLALWKEHINDSSHGEESPQSRNLVSSLFSRLSLKDTHVLQEGSDLCQKEVICVYWAQRRTRKDSDCDFALIYSQEHPPYSRDTLCFPHTEQENPQFTCLRVTAEEIHYWFLKRRYLRLSFTDAVFTHLQPILDGSTDTQKFSLTQIKRII